MAGTLGGWAATGCVADGPLKAGWVATGAAQALNSRNIVRKKK